MVAALLSVPSTVLIEPRPEAVAYGLTLVAIATGVACFVIPWGRLSTGWLHVVAIAAVVQIAAALVLIDAAYGFYLIFVIGFVAYVFPRWEEIAAHLGLMTIALVAPVFLDPENGRETLRSAVLYLPGLVAVGLTMAYLRDRQVAKEEAYSRFAHDVLGIASLIRSSAARRAAGNGEPEAPESGDGSVGPPIEAILADARHAARPDPIEARWRSLRARPAFVPLAALVSVGGAVCVIVLAIATLSLVGPSAGVDELAVEAAPPLAAPARGAQLGELDRRSKPREGEPRARERDRERPPVRRATAEPEAPASRAVAPAPADRDGDPPSVEARFDYAAGPAPSEPEAPARRPAAEAEAPAGNSAEAGSENDTVDVLDDVIGGGLDALGSLLGRN